MYYFEVCEIGRESVKSVNASILAALIKELVSRHDRNTKCHNRKFYIRCREKLEFSPRKYKKKIGDDEGFESDGNEEDSLSGDLSNEDAQSTASSCCMVEDHVFKTKKTDPTGNNSCGKDPNSLVSIMGSIDSANSSGSSDTDEIEFHSLTTSPISHTKKATQKSKYHSARSDEIEKTETFKSKKEEYPISDVIFCHTEPKHPNVIAWVIKKQSSDHGSRLGITGVESFSKIDNCLEVVVIKCRNADNLRELCSSYQEYSRRTKLDNYKSIKRKKDEEATKSNALIAPNHSKEVKVSLSDMKVASSGLIKASELSILNPKIVANFRSEMKNSVSLNSLLKVEKYERIGNSTKFDIKANFETKSASVLVGSNTSPSSGTKSQSLLNVSNPWESTVSKKTAKSNVLKEKNSDSSEQFNLVQRTDQNGMTHLEVTKNWREKKTTIGSDRFSNKSKLRKEIEGVILTDAEGYAKKGQVRQRDDGEQGQKAYECPPIRPERRKKKNDAPSPPDTGKGQRGNLPGNPSIGTGNGKNVYFQDCQNNENRPGRDQKTIKGPFIDAQSWQNQNVRECPGRNWKKPETRGRSPTKTEEKTVEKRRSRSAGRPLKTGPMAYRYIYLTGDGHQDYHHHHHHRPEGHTSKRGIPSKIREVGENLTNSIHNLRRRNSFDDVINYNNNNNNSGGGSARNLKSVIKKSKKINDKYCEPKKVTFSAFATVQVVD